MALFKKKNKPIQADIGIDTEDYLSALDNVEDGLLITKADREHGIESYYNGGLTLEEIEKREYLQAKRELAIATKKRKKEERKEFLKSMGRPRTIIGYLLMTIVSTLYLYYASGQLGFSIFCSLIGAFWWSYWFIYKVDRVNRHEEDLNTLEQLARDIAFHAESGRNTYETLSRVRNNYGGRVGADVDYTFSLLKSETRLDISYFEAYEFTPIDLFMRNLVIWYNDGANTKKLFARSISNIAFELTKRDELRKINEKKLTEEMMCWGIIATFPVAIRALGGATYTIVLGKPVALVILLTLFYFGMVKVATNLKKLSLDVNIR